MNLKSITLCAICACTAFAGSAFAQEKQQSLNPLQFIQNTKIEQNSDNGQNNTPIDGQMVKLDAKKLWRMNYLPNTNIHNPEIIAQNLTHPTISPNGERIIMFERGNPGEHNALHEWTPQTQREIMREDNVSVYVTWDNNNTFAMRERSNPFRRDTALLKYDTSHDKLTTKGKTQIADETFVTYDANDVIILESKKTKTLQAISDTRADRYYAPVLSPDQRFVAFNGLTSGLHIFDIESNAVVFIASHATDPAFSPDGKYLVYTVSSDNGHQIQSADLVIIDLQNRSYRYISNPEGEIRIRASLSKDAKFISYQTDDNQIVRAQLNL